MIWTIEFDYDFKGTTYKERERMFGLGRYFKGTEEDVKRVIEELTQNKAIRATKITPYGGTAQLIAESPLNYGLNALKEQMRVHEEKRYLKSGYR